MTLLTCATNVITLHVFKVMLYDNVTKTLLTVIVNRAYLIRKFIVIEAYTLNIVKHISLLRGIELSP